MRILFINHHSLESNSGIHIYNLANQLSKMGLEILVCVPNQKEAAFTLGKPLFEIFNYAEFRPIASNYKIDLIHAWTPRETVRGMTEELARLCHSPYVVHLEDNEEILLSKSIGKSTQELNGYSRAFLDTIIPGHLSHPLRYKEFLGSASGVTVIMDTLREFCPPELPREVIWAGYEAERNWNRPADPVMRGRLGISKGERIVVYTGNVHSANQAEVFSLYLAVGLLNEKGLRTRLVRTGVDYVPLIPDTLSDLKSYCLECGFVPRNELPSLLSLADVLVQPGKADLFNNYRFPSKLPEYLASGKPVLLPNANIGRFLKDGLECLLLENGSALEVASQLEMLFEDPALMEKIGSGGRAFAIQHLGWEHSALKLSNFYAQVLGVPAANLTFSPTVIRILSTEPENAPAAPAPQIPDQNHEIKLAPASQLQEAASGTGTHKNEQVPEITHHKPQMNTDPILVYQMGKVGSITIQTSLERTYRDLGLNVPIHHVHLMNLSLEDCEIRLRDEYANLSKVLGAVGNGLELRKTLEKTPEQRLKIITLVRDPVARNVATFFESLDSFIPDWQEQIAYQLLSVDDLHRIFLTKKTLHRGPHFYFDDEIKPVLGIDVFEEEFPIKTGYKIYPDNQHNPMLLIRLEDLDQCARTAIQEFLGIENFQLTNANIGAQKEYAALYEAFKQKPLPEEYLNEMYGTRFSRHFYSDAELQAFKERWSRPGKPQALPAGYPLTSRNPVIIYQMGEVGAAKVEQSLIHAYQERNIKSPIHRIHFLNYIKERLTLYHQRREIPPDIFMNDYEKESFMRLAIDSNPSQRWDLISLVRDPVARNVSSFFEALNDHFPDWIEKYKKGLLTTGTLRNYFLSESHHFVPENWFDSQMKPVFNIDVFARPFPTDRGYQIYPASARARLLVIRTEDLDRAAPGAMKEYLNLDNFSLLHGKPARKKAHSDLYEAFISQPLPSYYVERIYNTRFARQFYSPEELQNFTGRWTGNSPQR